MKGEGFGEGLKVGEVFTKAVALRRGALRRLTGLKAPLREKTLDLTCPDGTLSFRCGGH